MSSALLRWLGFGSASSADGATWQLDSAWRWPPWATVLLLFAALIVTAILYARESSEAGRWYRALLIGLRLIVLVIVLIMIAQWALVLRITGPPALALVIDRSASMGIADRYGEAELPAGIRERLVANGISEPTRLNLAKLLVSENNGRFLRTMADRYRLETYFVAAGVERQPPSASIEEVNQAIQKLSHDGPGSQATRLGDAVRQVISDVRAAPPAAVILLSDGIATEGVPLADAAEDARRRGVPIFAVGLGSDVPPRDTILSDVLVDEAVFVNELVSLEVQIKASGLEGQPAKLTLRRDSAAEAVAEQTVSLPADGQILNVRMVDRPTVPGPINYVVEVAPRDDEIDERNNVERRSVTALDQKIRVLMMSGHPSYEFRFLKTLLERDRTVELATYLQDADPDYAEQDKTALRGLPVSREDLFEYDVIVVNDIDPRLLPSGIWQSLRAFVVEKGGGVAFLAGPRYLPQLYGDNSDVAALLPMELGEADAPQAIQLPEEVTGGFRVRPTPLGLQSPALQLGDTLADTERIWSELAPLYWMYELDDLKPAAQVLADRAGRPIIVFQYVGAGRVLFHGVDATWRWRLGAGDKYFARYWVQTIRFLARGKLTSGQGARISTDRREYKRGEAVKVRARFLDPKSAPSGDAVIALVEGTGDSRRQATLRRNPTVDALFEATLTELAQGNYEVTLIETPLSGSPPSARFTVAAPPGEFARTEMDAAAMTQTAAQTGGRFYRVGDAERLLADLPAGHRVPVETLPPVAIWNRWWLLAAFVAAISSEWILRKRKGML